METLPFGRGGSFYRGNMHTHSTNSDGRLPPAQVAAAYRDNGYDFLVLSDHFQACYGWQITDTSDLRGNGFTTINGAELHAPETRLGELWHIKAVGLPLDFAPPDPDETGLQLARRAADAGAFIGIVHPSWYGLTHADACTIDVAHAVEIYNHGSHIELDRGNDWPFLDGLLNEGWRLSGYASDDAHFWVDDCFGGWVWVQADDLEPEALIDSLKQGRYYSSQGPVLHDVAVGNEKVALQCSPVSNVAITGRGAKSENHRGSEITHCELPVQRFQGSWFRITVMDAQGRRAWTNPVWLD